MNPIVILLIAIFFEVVGTTSLKLSEGFSRPVPSIMVVIGYGLTFYFLSLALRSFPLGTAYAIWSGLGTIGAVTMGVIIWNEGVDFWRIVGIALIVVGVIILNLFAEGVAA